MWIDVDKINTSEQETFRNKKSLSTGFYFEGNQTRDTWLSMLQEIFNIKLYEC